MRVVSLACSNTEIVCALGCANMLVGVDDHSDYPEEVVAALPRVGPDLDIDVERVAALRPDLVLASLTVPGHERIIERLERAGLPYLAPEPTSLAHVLRDVGEIARALGQQQRGRALEARLSGAFAPAPVVDARPSILVEWWPKPVIVPGRDSWVSELIELAGGRNPFAGRPVKSTPITDEEAALAQPDAVVMSWCGVRTEKYRRHVVERRAAWRDFPALRHGRVVPIPEAWLGRPGPRLVQGLAALRGVVASCAVAHSKERASASSI